MTPRYITARGSGVAASSPYYVGHVQHDGASAEYETLHIPITFVISG